MTSASGAITSTGGRRRPGYRSRAIFKLEEIDRVQPAVQARGPGPRPRLRAGLVAAVRAGPGRRPRRAGRHRPARPCRPTWPAPGIIVGDVYETTPEELRGDLPGFDVVLSDMAPDTTGIRHVDQARSEALFERALELASQTLVPGRRVRRQAVPGPRLQAADRSVPRPLRRGQDHQAQVEPAVLHRAVRRSAAASAARPPEAEHDAAPGHRAVGHAVGAQDRAGGRDPARRRASPRTRPTRSTRWAARSRRATRSSGSTGPRAWPRASGWP